MIYVWVCEDLKIGVSLFSILVPRWLSLVERLPRKQQAAGSKPARGSIIFVIAYLCCAVGLFFLCLTKFIKCCDTRGL